MESIYLDNNATTKPCAEALAAMNEALRSDWFNPSSVHRAGQQARRQVELARSTLGQLIGCRDREIVFTSGGTEADNLAIRGSLAAQPKRTVLVTSRLEHSAVRETAEKLAEQGVEVRWLESDDRGVIRLDALADLLRSRASDIALVSIMWANNETGVVQPVEEIGEMCRAHGVRFHTDAVQWIGKVPTDIARLPIDLLSLSAHKFHGPKGIGALYLRQAVRLAPEITGGPQERERRGGTENAPGIVGMAAAARAAMEWLNTDDAQRVRDLRDRFERTILDRIPDSRINGSEAPRIWNTTNIAFHRLESEAILLSLSERGVYASAGAACSSGSLEPSPVLLAMGVPEPYAHGSIRFSLSRETTEAEVDRAIPIVEDAVRSLQRSMSAV